jgi:predicted Rossmann fold flavoprotein
LRFTLDQIAMSAHPIVVIGAGAAGLMAAIFAAEHAGARVLLLERTRDGGRKILISGGGRCNVLPSEIQPARFVTDSSPHTLRNLLRSWPLAEQRAFFETTLRIPLALETETGKLFPVSNSARHIRDGLIEYAGRRGVDTRFNCRVIDVLPRGDAGAWTVVVEGGPPIEAAAVILATGGLSVPATGSDGGGLAIAGRLGHTIRDTYPALTPLVADPAVHETLAGVSLHARLRAPAGNGRPVITEGGMLFTHRGYSGPAVLDISHVAVRARLAQQSQAIQVQWTMRDEAAWQEILRHGDGLVATRVRQHLPNRLADWLVADAGIPLDQALANLTRAQRVLLIERLCRYPLPWTGDEGYKKAEVTGGGVALEELDPRTLESRRQPGLFLCGELLDAFGPIGGHNFAWAWATGRLAGLGAAARVSIPVSI